MDRIADAPRQRRSTVAAQPALEQPLAAAGVASNPLAAGVIGPAFSSARTAPALGPVPRRTLQVMPAMPLCLPLASAHTYTCVFKFPYLPRPAHSFKYTPARPCESPAATHRQPSSILQALVAHAAQFSCRSA